MKRESTFYIKNREFKVEDVLPYLITIPGNYLSDSLSENGLSIPKSDRTQALKKALRDNVIKEVNENKNKEWVEIWKNFDNFSETLLELTFQEMNLKPLRTVYYEELWLVLMEYLLFRRTHEDLLETFIKVSTGKIVTDGKTIPSVSTFNKETENVFFDEGENIDGVSRIEFEKIMTATNSLEIVKKVASKYGVRLQDSWKKKEFERLVVEEVKEKKLFEKKEESAKIKELRALPIEDLEKFAIDNKLDARIELKLAEKVNLLADDILASRSNIPLNPRQTMQIKKLNEEKKKLDEELKAMIAKNKKEGALSEAQIKSQQDTISTLESELKNKHGKTVSGTLDAIGEAKLQEKIRQLEKALNEKNTSVVSINNDAKPLQERIYELEREINYYKNIKESAKTDARVSYNQEARIKNLTDMIVSLRSRAEVLLKQKPMYEREIRELKEQVSLLSEERKSSDVKNYNEVIDLKQVPEEKQGGAIVVSEDSSPKTVDRSQNANAYITTVVITVAVIIVLFAIGLILWYYALNK